jgi:hypothetical protein
MLDENHTFMSSILVQFYHTELYRN